jgi:reactive chlorine resistance protein C
MSIFARTANPPLHNAVAKIEPAGALLARYGLVIVIAWIGALKFTSYEAQGIAPLVSTVRS